MSRKKIAVFFGGRAPEHDVSIVTGLQALNALDTELYEAFPVYIGLDGQWYGGVDFARKYKYLPSTSMKNNATEYQLAMQAEKGRGRLIAKAKGLFSSTKEHFFDVALLAFHGAIGEDGGVQGLMNSAGIAYTGMRQLAASLFMDKAATKRALAGHGVSMLPDVLFERPEQGLVIDKDTLAKALGSLSFPLCVKPVHLGSSIGVGKAENLEELQALLASIFAHDWQALAEPFIPNLVEYNVAVMRCGHQVVTSAIEKPKRSEELLDFKQKYLSKNGKMKGGKKQPGLSSEGLLSLTRTVNPDLDPAREALIRNTASQVFQAYGGRGAPRIDFYGNEQTGEIWFNELNPCPGSFGFFLWEGAREPLMFSRLLTHLIDEALVEQKLVAIGNDPVPEEARLFRRTS